MSGTKRNKSNKKILNRPLWDSKTYSTPRAICVIYLDCLFLLNKNVEVSKMTCLIHMHKI